MNQNNSPPIEAACSLDDDDILQEQPSSKIPKVDHQAKYNGEEIDIASLVRDLGLCPQIWEYAVNQRDEIRRAYIKYGPYGSLPSEFSYPFSGPESHRRRFQESWLRKFPWLEYSPAKDAAFCLPCYLFSSKSIGKFGSDTFTATGFKNWKKVNNGKDCAFLSHMGRTPNSSHNVCVKSYEDLRNQSSHIEKAIEKQSTQQVQNNRLRLKASIDAVRWLSFQACAFRGHDEHPDSENQGNFLEMLDILASYNKEVNDVVLKNAPQNAKYTSPAIQKEILHVYSRNVQLAIREEISCAKFCLIVDESQDESKREQMTLVVRFVDKDGFVRERFLDLIHVKDTSSLTLKEGIYSTLSHHNLSVENIRGQGYDGASNMRGEWNGLQALILKDCPYAYYVHCLAHQLQLVLVAAAREVADIHVFFKNLSFIVNAVSASSKRNDELQAQQIAETKRLVENDELDTGKGANQIRTLQRPGDTRWSSHFNSICSLISIFGATCSVLQTIAVDGSNFAQRGDAKYALKLLMSFEFIFILHVMKELMGISDALCQSLQLKSQDILNAMHLVSHTKLLIQRLRDEGWEALLQNVVSFCKQHNIGSPNMNALFSDIIQSRHQKDIVTVEHHYRVDIFTATIDQQLQELNSRFSEQSTELLILSTTLSPRDNFKSFKIDDICTLAEKFYPEDFTDKENFLLKFQLQLFELDVPNHPELGKLSTIAELCRGLVETGKSDSYPLVDRLIRLILTLSVSTATSERAFSAMKILKTRLHNKMEDDFLRDSMIMYIEKKIARTISVDKIIDDFYLMKERRAQLK